MDFRCSTWAKGCHWGCGLDPGRRRRCCRFRAAAAAAASHRAGVLLLAWLGSRCVRTPPGPVHGYLNLGQGAVASVREATTPKSEQDLSDQF